ncbi:acetyltransferase [Paracoccus sp. (in: a-proteobacteria)]|uniref:acetyltransferase n=1 Tax=Paracoccus sp. TaxID=267 RepID=UPI0026E01320|nr:acetyltransferase [Paracoccus sp. (in: a-proteobacteria)]MDO5647478.1 acetyltransferase [Paracoccus sp. (in: a-proteobacteria)]
MRSTTDFTDLVLFGARGTAQMILAGLESFWQGRVTLRAVVDEVDHGHTHPLGVPVISPDDRARLYPDVPVMLGAGRPDIRQHMARQIWDQGGVLATAVAPGQYHTDADVTYGAGCVCVPHVRIGPNVRIGTGAQILGELLAHDVTVGDWSTVGIDAAVLGHVTIGTGVNIAPRAVIGNGTADRPLTIGDGAIIGVGAVVVRDVAPGARMVGNPAMTVDRWRALNRLLDGASDAP